MGAIISKLCCCTGQRRRPTKSVTKLSRNPSLIIERTRVLKTVTTPATATGADEDGGSEYSRVERDFEIKSKRVINKSQLTSEGQEEFKDIKRSDSIIKVCKSSNKTILTLLILISL